MNTNVNIKPFRLEEWKNGSEVRTRDGRKVDQLTHFINSQDIYQLHGVVDGDIISWTCLGQYSLKVEEHNKDLVIVEKPYFVNLYKSVIGKIELGAYIFNTPEEAQKEKSGSTYFLGTYKLIKV